MRNNIIYFLFSLIVYSCASNNKASKIEYSAETSLVIILDQAPTSIVSLAASELQQYLLKIYGFQVPILNKIPGTVDFIFFVGRSNYTDSLGVGSTFTDNAFQMTGNGEYLALLGDDLEFVPREPYPRSYAQVERVTKQWYALCGHDWSNPLINLYKQYDQDLNLWEFDHSGTLQAVYEYFRILGVRWYMPGEIGEALPETPIDPFIVIDTFISPSFLIRDHYHYFNNFNLASRDEILYRYRLGLNGGSDIMGHGPPGHGIDHILSSTVLKDEHPEYYGLKDGVRQLEGSELLPCLSQAGLVEEAVNYVESVFEIYDEPAVSIMPPDGFTNACDCENCKKLRTSDRGENGKYSDYVWSFVNQVAKRLYSEYPNKDIICFAYSTYLLPPENIQKLSPNILVGLCRRRASLNQEKIKEDEELIASWKEKTGGNKMVFWDYYLTSRPKDRYYSVPVVFPHIIKEDINRNLNSSYGDFIEVYRERDEETPLSLATNHLNLYITARLYWDPFLDIDRLLEEYYQGFYGLASQQMKEFFQIAEVHWPSLTSEPDIINRIFDQIKNALERVESGSKYWERIKLIENYIAPLKEISSLASRKRSLEGRLRFIHGDPSLFEKDGFPSPAFWSRHHPFPLKGSDESTTIQVAHTPKGIYCHIICSDRNMNGMIVSGRSDDDRRIVTGENIEFLFETTLHSYYRFAINPEGLVLDSDESAKADINWNSLIQHRVTKTSKSWIVDLMIPSAVIGDNQNANIQGRLPTETFPWYFNLRRNRVNESGSAKLYFRAVPEEQFYNPETFVRFYKR